jgi:hypothetical protein
MRWPNYHANKLLTLAAKLRFAAGIFDEATAYKAFRRSVLASMELKCMRASNSARKAPRSCGAWATVSTRFPCPAAPGGITEDKTFRWQDNGEALFAPVR